MLEDIIFKLVPGLQERERHRLEEFNKNVRSGKKDLGSVKNRQKDTLTDEPPQKKFRSMSRKAQHSDDSDGNHNFHRDDPQIGVCLQYLRNCIDDGSEYREGKPGSGNMESQRLSERSREESNLNGTMWELVRKYIRCSSRTTIGHIKKYLKLKLNLSAVDQVEVMCNGEIMGKDHTLEFVFMTRWRVKDSTILTLQYRPKLEFL